MVVTMACKYLLSVKVSGSLIMMPNESCENIVLWRGHFNSNGQERSLNLSINGGEGIPYATGCKEHG